VSAPSEVIERLEDTLQRLAKEREEADRRYNDALTALDRAHPRPSNLPSPHRSFDEHQLAALNDAWKVVPGPPQISGMKGRLVGFAWRIVAPYLQRQLIFNSVLVDHLNRTTSAARESHRASEELAAALESRFAALNEFTFRLVLYLQQITAYVDTRDRDSAKGGLILNAALSGAAENLEKRFESLNARFEALNTRFERTTTTLASADADLRTSVAVAQQASQALKREVERMLESQPEPARPTVSVPGSSPSSAEPFGQFLDSFKYVGFEDLFRGSRDAISNRFASYVPLFAGKHNVLDVGCGRGEFLELLRAAGVGARGIDLNHEMVELCRERGLDVVKADAVGYLSGLADASLDGIFSAQVVEHLKPSYLLRFLELTFEKLRPGGTLVLETLNPACWVAFFDSYIRDITHVWPLHPDTLKYLVLASGFTQADVQFRSPVGEEHKLRAIPVPAGAEDKLSVVAEAFNENVQKLNSRLFTHLDYAIIASR
jgi:SAM-dependent methyltransferase